MNATPHCYGDDEGLECEQPPLFAIAHHGNRAHACQDHLGTIGAHLAALGLGEFRVDVLGAAAKSRVTEALEAVTDWAEPRVASRRR